mmetsp:Transcript_53257/g.142531  ORF Transcript_53257/g.142531 Transcript_53257/m.142531 type:complete len:80 (-) Transcript_53257:1171-1410(-)
MWEPTFEHPCRPPRCQTQHYGARSAHASHCQGSRLSQDLPVKKETRATHGMAVIAMAVATGFALTGLLTCFEIQSLIAS